mmetsp:Transcript_10965/g.16551  ORF Transcript_10965/g.16551 Transcript_10965/m.16551 type:complete len:260 (+) Transcript_10965:407-1186(+)
MVNNSNGILNLTGHNRCLLRGDGHIKVQINNVVTVISDSNLITVRLVGRAGSHTQDSIALARNGGKVLHELQSVEVAERGDLNRDGETRSEGIGQLTLVDNDNELISANLHHLLTQEGSSTTLDEVQVGVNFIGSINSHVELRMGVECNKRNSELLSLLLRTNRGRDGDNVLKLARFELLSKALDGEVGGGASSETNDHARFYVIIDGLVSDHLLELILGEGGSHFQSKARSWAKGGRGEGRSSGCEASENGNCETHGY